VPLIVVGNKCDLEDKRQVPTETGQELAQRQGFIFMETSAKTNTNIETTFQELATKLVEQEASKPKTDTGGSNVILGPAKSSSKKSKCCK
jgi:GTPase SAR1 family protein